MTVSTPFACGTAAFVGIALGALVVLFIVPMVVPPRAPPAPPLVVLSAAEMRSIQASTYEKQRQTGREEFSRVAADAARKNRHIVYMGPQWLMTESELYAAGYRTTTDGRGNWKIRSVPYSPTERKTTPQQCYEEEEYRHRRDVYEHLDCVTMAKQPECTLDSGGACACCVKMRLDELERQWHATHSVNK